MNHNKRYTAIPRAWKGHDDKCHGAFGRCSGGVLRIWTSVFKRLPNTRFHHEINETNTGRRCNSGIVHVLRLIHNNNNTPFPVAKRWGFQEYSTIAARDFEKGQVEPREFDCKIKKLWKNHFYFFFALCTRREIFLCGITRWFFFLFSSIRARPNR